MKIFNRSWWCEKVIEVPEHGFDWMAPRWYGYILVPFAYILMLAIVVFMVTFSCTHKDSNNIKQLETAVEVNTNR